MMHRWLGTAILLLACGFGRTQAQATCRIIEVPGNNASIMNPGTPQETVVITGGAHLECSDGRTLRADRATRIAASQRIELLGNVDVRDTERRLTAAEATFFSQTRQLDARGDAVLYDLVTGSTIRGDRVLYLQATEQNPESRVEATATTGRARAVLFRETAPDVPGSADSAAPDSTLVFASQITIIGEQTFRAVGDAEMIRDSLRATGFSIAYTQVSGSLQIARGSRVELPRQELLGDSIDATLGDDDELREVLTRHGAALAAQELNVTAPAIRLFFEDGGVTRMVAMQWPPAASAAADARSRVDAENFVMEADSIDVLAPGQQITTAVAIGNAYGERITPDSLRGPMPAATAEQTALLSSDWVRGDTVRARFGAGTAAAGDVEQPERVMENLLALGDPALSVYAVRDEDDPDAPLSFNYLSASTIEVEFAAGAVSQVTASGDARGMYLQPGQPGATAGNSDRNRPGLPR